MVTDTFPALALSLEPADRDVMTRPPRDPGEALVSGAFLGSIAFYAALITAVSLVAFLWMLNRAPDRAATACFMTLGLAQILHLGNARSPHHVLRPTRGLINRAALGAVALSIALQWVAISWRGIADTVRLHPPRPEEWLVIAGASGMPAIVGQGLKLWRGRAGDTSVS
jgi:P-type Ca2+ transporter type 2C